jgi:hypothetical protein
LISALAVKRKWYNFSFWVYNINCLIYVLNFQLKVHAPIWAFLRIIIFSQHLPFCYLSTKNLPKFWFLIIATCDVTKILPKTCWKYEKQSVNAVSTLTVNRQLSCQVDCQSSALLEVVAGQVGKQTVLLKLEAVEMKVMNSSWEKTRTNW